MSESESIREAVVNNQIDYIRSRFATHTETGLDFLIKKMVKAHLVFEEVQKRNEARGFVYGYDDKGRFVVLKTPDGFEEH